MEPAFLGGDSLMASPGKAPSARTNRVMPDQEGEGSPKELAEYHPARQSTKILCCCDDFGSLPNYLFHLDCILAISIVAGCHSGLDETILSIEL